MKRFDLVRARLFACLTRRLLSRAQAGNAKAQFALAAAYERGTLGIAQDRALALHWYRKAADQGSSEAQRHLAHIYRRGFGTLKDYESAVSLYREAAKQGDAQAMVNLGDMYLNGLGLTSDISAALALFHKSAAMHHPVAYMKLSAIYYYGLNVPRNRRQGAKWFAKLLISRPSLAAKLIIGLITLKLRNPAR